MGRPAPHSSQKTLIERNENYMETFETSPFITPAAIKADPETALVIMPKWAAFVARLRDLEPLAPSHAFLLHIRSHRSGKTHAKPKSLTALQIAILFELTRYGGSILEDGDGHGNHYWKLTGMKNKQGVVIARIWEDAGPGERVFTNPITSRIDQTPGSLVTEGDLSAKKNGRVTAIQEAEARAKWKLKSNEAGIKAYLSNLTALLAAYHAEAVQMQQAA
jgi:hypothetical protein